MPRSLLEDIVKLSVKMRLLKAHYTTGNNADDLNDRQALIVEILADQGPMSVSELVRHFPGVAQSTISSDIKALRLPERGLLDVHLDKQDMRKHTVSLTTAGQEKARDISNQKTETYLHLARALPKNTKKMQIVQDVVNKAIGIIEQALSNLNED